MPRSFSAQRRSPNAWLWLAVLAVCLAANPHAQAQSASAPRLSLFNPGTNAQFGAAQGFAVAIDGPLAVVGAPNDDTGASDAGIAKVYDARTGALLHTLQALAPTEDHRFGIAVAISGQRVVVGAAYETVLGVWRTGRAYAYDLTRPNPTVPVATFNNPHSGSQARFGGSVAISGTRVCIGADWSPSAAPGTGSAYVYDLAAPTPAIPLLTLIDPAQTGFSYNPIKVAITGTRVVLANPNSRRAYVHDLRSNAPATPFLTLTNPGPADGNFGVSVAYDGNRIAIGAPAEGFLNEERVYLYDLAGAAPPVPFLVLTNPVPYGPRGYGTVLALAGPVVAIGVPRIAYIYRLQGATPGAPVATLTNANPEVDDAFGSSLALTGERLIVGAPGDDALGWSSGRADVYDLSGDSPALLSILNAPSLALGERFGHAIALSGTQLVVGAPYAPDRVPTSGNALVYDLAGPTPDIPRFKLRSMAPVYGDAFGASVAIAGSRVVVGAPGTQFEQPSLDIGAWVYDLESASPETPVTVLEKPYSGMDDSFGHTVGISGNLVVVGAPNTRVNGFNDPVGGAFVFNLASGTPRLPSIVLTNPAPQSSEHLIPADQFGFAVAISGTKVLVAARWDLNLATLRYGTVYVYDLAGPVPNVPMVTLTNPAPQVWSWSFGTAVALDGNLAAIGSPSSTERGPNSGSVYVYNLASANPATPFLVLHNPSPLNGASNDVFGSSVHVSGSRLVVGAPGEDVGATNAGAIYVYELTGDSPAVPIAVYYNPTRGTNDAFGTAVAIQDMTVVTGAPGQDTQGSDRGAAFVYTVGPRLRLTRASPEEFHITWTPTNMPGLLLLSSDGRTPPDWMKVLTGGQNPVVVPATNLARFYRLVQSAGP